MKLTKTIQVLNEMQSAGVIGCYAIGGAIAAFLYIEPGATFDIDTFVSFEAPGGALISLAPIYEYLQKRGYSEKREMVEIEGWPVQFLPPTSPLVTEALRNAPSITIEGVETRVFSREHLMAICLETGRPKDIARLVQFMEDGGTNDALLGEILARHHLQEKWERFKLQFNE